MSDKSDAIIGATEAVFPGIEIRICFFHVMQAMHRWLRKADNGVTDGRHFSRSRARSRARSSLLNAFSYRNLCFLSIFSDSAEIDRGRVQGDGHGKLRREICRA